MVAPDGQAAALAALDGFHDFEPGEDDFEGDVLAGLSKPRKAIPAKYFYDKRGSELFDRICELPEYYPTRTELGILREAAPEIGELAGPRACVVEFGSGSSVKSRLLLDALEAPLAYVPVEISREHLIASAHALSEAYPGLVVEPVCADYTRDYSLPDVARQAARRIGFFPGSTIGNFTRPEAEAFLTHIAEILGPGSALVIGADLKKDEKVLFAAYNDAAGVTAAFNVNLLERINRELGGTFDLQAFRHHAPWNARRGCIEMHLVSLKRQSVTVAGRRFDFEEGEVIHTEDSHKYEIAEFQAMARSAGWRPEYVWTDPGRLFSLHYMTV